MAGAYEILRDRRRAAHEAKNAGGPRENKNAPPPRLPGLALPSSRFSSKGARRLAIENGLTEADFVGAPCTGEQDRYTIADMRAILERRAAAAATPKADE